MQAEKDSNPYQNPVEGQVDKLMQAEKDSNPYQNPVEGQVDKLTITEPSYGGQAKKEGW